MQYDSTARTASKSVDLYDETRPITRVHKEIALLTCEGAAKEEIDMTKGMIEKGRLMGADAIVMLPPLTGSDVGGGRAVFRAKAVIYEQ